MKSRLIPVSYEFHFPSRPGRLSLAFIAILYAHFLSAQAKEDGDRTAPVTTLETVNAHIEKINEIGKKLKDRMRAGFPPVQTKQEAVEIVEATFSDIIRFKAHYVLARSAAKLLPRREEERIRIRGVKNAYFPGDFLDYLPLVEKLQKHVQEFQIQVDFLDWYARYEGRLEEDTRRIAKEFEANPPKARREEDAAPIGEAVERKLVEAAVSGDGCGTLRLKLVVRDLSGRGITVSVPVWTAAIPLDETRQIMLVREPAMITVEANGSETQEIPAVCADLRTKERPSQERSCCRFGEYPAVCDLAAIQNIIGVVDLIEVKGGYAGVRIPHDLRAHTIVQLCVWRYLSKSRGDAEADIGRDSIKIEIPLQLGRRPDQLSPAEAKEIDHDAAEILKKVDEVLLKLDI